MSMEELIALQPAWIGLWLNWLFFGAFILPFALFIWKETRPTALITLVASGLGSAAIFYMFEKMGYVKLLGLPHLIFWTPLCFYLYKQIKRADISKWPRWIMIVVLATIVISLAFDYTDVARWVLGERTPFTGQNL